MKRLSNGLVSLAADMEYGQVTELKFASDIHDMNYLISPQVLRQYEYDDAKQFLFGSSFLSYCGHEIETGLRTPDHTEETEDTLTFTYFFERVQLTHRFILNHDRLIWEIEVENIHDQKLELEKLYHWMPISYIMHKSLDQNLNHSCAMVPSINGSNPYLICKKRSGFGRNLIVYNESGHLKSVGSYCRFTNLFFEKSSPSLNGLILFNMVNAHKNEQSRKPLIDWQYKDMYQSIHLEPGQIFKDCYILTTCDEGAEDACIYDLGGTTVDFQPVVMKGRPVHFCVNSKKQVKACRILAAGVQDNESICLLDISIDIDKNIINTSPIDYEGEMKAVFEMDDESFCYVIFTIYDGMKQMIDAICNYIYTDRFVDDPNSPEFCAYRSISLQGESCAKGTLLLVKNYLDSQVNKNEIKQVEQNTVHFVMPNWFDDQLIPLKKYSGGFARMADLSYIIQQLYMLSKFEGLLSLNSAETYLLWAYKLAVYRLKDTPDKRDRERDEMGGPFMMRIGDANIADDLMKKGYENESKILSMLLQENVDKHKKMRPENACITEHYFDNAGLSTVAMFFFKHGFYDKAMKLARLLLANVADSNDYRNYAPDRWWEALAPMYHNLWAAFPAKALLLAYEYCHENKYLFAAYRSMMPLFYNYDWKAWSAERSLKKGEGVSTYNLTAPNLNLEYASHNRFGQSVFKGEFFDKLHLAGDDWDMGMDVILYLDSFGQNTYITIKDNQLVAVNGLLDGHKDHFNVKTDAPYGGKYYIEPFNMTVSRANNSFTIEKITVINGICQEAYIRGTGPVEILCKQNETVEVIKPRIIRIDE